MPSHRVSSLLVVPALLVPLALGATTACATPGDSPRTRARREPSIPCIEPLPARETPGRASLHDAGPSAHDGAMPLELPPSERFAIEPAQLRVELFAGERAQLPIALVRAEGHDAYVELKASGLPRGVYATAAFGPLPSALALVFEAEDTAAIVSDAPFVVEAHADGVRVSRRLLLTILPERATPEE